ncbi:hypothetical protein PM082_010971 [Marasmius tenuissimus]|nr:hypothetical protein PM082_010971 [Marasmius tenuissimus]
MDVMVFVEGTCVRNLGPIGLNYYYTGRIHKRARLSNNAHQATQIASTSGLSGQRRVDCQV